MRWPVKRGAGPRQITRRTLSIGVDEKNYATDGVFCHGQVIPCGIHPWANSDSPVSKFGKGDLRGENDDRSVETILIPFYNIIVLLKIVGRPWWWLILAMIPLVNFIFAIIINIDLAKSFGKGVGFAIGLILLAPIFIMILGFGDVRYQGPAAA